MVPGGRETARTYDYVAVARRAALSEAGAAPRVVFEGAYALAVQVMELREKHGLYDADEEIALTMDLMPTRCRLFQRDGIVVRAMTG